MTWRYFLGIAMMLCDLMAQVFAIVCIVGATKQNQWAEACFWLLFIILIELRKITDK